MKGSNGSMNAHCPKCQSNNTYFDGVDNACRTCGERWPLGGFLPAMLLKIDKKPMPDAKPKKVCRNCQRDKKIVGDGLCTGCYSVVYGKYKKGTAEYDEVLAEAKKRFTDPSYKHNYVRLKDSYKTN